MHFSRIPAPLLLHATAAILLLAVLWRPVHDSDLFWQLRLGELILERGWPPEREPFLAGRESETFVPVAWLGQGAYAGIRQLGGYSLLHVVDGLLWVGGLFVVGWSTRRTGATLWATIAALVLANLTAYSSVSTRPQTFSLVGFGLLIALIRSGLSERLKLFLGLLLLVVWQNFHPSAAVGGAWLAAVAVAGWGRWLRRGGAWPWVTTALALATPLAMVATPAGFDLVRISTYNTEISRWLGVSEWLPLWELDTLDRLEVWIGLASLIVLLAWHGRRVGAEDLLPALLLAILALASYRFVLFWAVAMIPVWASVLSPHRSERSIEETGHLTRGGRVLAILFWVLAVAIPMVRHPTHLAGYLPFAAVERLQAHGESGTIYCNSVWAGVLLDAGSPGWRVTHDGRYYLQPIAVWQEYLAAGRGEVPIAHLVDRFRPFAFVLRTGYDDGLIELLRHDSGWRELAPDRECFVFVRVNSPAAVDAGPPPR